MTYLERVENFVGCGIGFGFRASTIQRLLHRQWLAAGNSYLPIGTALAIGMLEMQDVVHLQAEMISAEGAEPRIRIRKLEIRWSLKPKTSASRFLEVFSGTWGELELAIRPAAQRAGRLALEVVRVSDPNFASEGRSPDFAQLLPSTGLTDEQYRGAVSQMLEKAQGNDFVSRLFANTDLFDARNVLLGIRMTGPLRLSTIDDYAWFAGDGKIEPFDLRAARNLPPPAGDVPPLPSFARTPRGAAEEVENEVLSYDVHFYWPRKQVADAIKAKLPSPVDLFFSGAPDGYIAASCVSAQCRIEILDVVPLFGQRDPYDYCGWEVHWRGHVDGMIQASQFDLCTEKSASPSKLLFESGPQKIALAVTKPTENELAPEITWDVSWGPIEMRIDPPITDIGSNSAQNSLNVWIASLPYIVAQAADLPWVALSRMTQDSSIECSLLAANNGLILGRATT